jgi:hypothetical protein
LEQIGSNEVPKSKVNKERVNTKKYLFGKRCVTQEDCQEEGRSTTVCHIKTHEGGTNDYDDANANTNTNNARLVVSELLDWIAGLVFSDQASGSDK